MAPLSIASCSRRHTRSLTSEYCTTSNSRSSHVLVPRNCVLWCCHRYAFMRQWGQHAKCMTMKPQMANGLQTWWHQLLQGATENGVSHESPMETVAIATGRLASGWHGTGEGEMAGWAGHWHYRPPAIAHFVGGAPAGGKVDLMQGALDLFIFEPRPKAVLFWIRLPRDHFESIILLPK